MKRCARSLSLVPLAALSACLAELTVAPCYSAADCPSGDVCEAARCRPVVCAPEASTRVRTVGFPYRGDRVPPAALAFDGARYWAVVEAVADVNTGAFELFTVALDARGERLGPDEEDVGVRGARRGDAVAPFLVRTPRGLIAGWNERATPGAPYIGYAGALGADGVVASPQALAGQIEELVLDGDAVFAPITIAGSRAALQALGEAMPTRFDDSALFAPSAARVPSGDWLVVAERGARDVQLLRLSAARVERDTLTLVEGAGEGAAPRAIWTGDALVVVYAQTTTAGSVVRRLETDAVGRITAPPLTLTGSVTALPSITYARARDELAVAYVRGGRVELLRLARRTGARVTHALSAAGVVAEDPVVVDAGGEYAVAWLQPDQDGDAELRMSRVVCR